MNWAIFAIAAWLALGIDLGLGPTLALGGRGGVVPSVAIAFTAYVAMWAPPRTALWAALLIGAAIDLTSELALAGRGTGVLLGPNALGVLFGTQFVLAARSLVVRKNPLSLMVMTTAASLSAQIVVLAVISARELIGNRLGFFGTPLAWDTRLELEERALSSLYSGLVSLVVAVVLIPLTPLFSFVTPTQARWTRRS
ncbi:MAG: hypothetical protein AAF747_06005 [Planctomycetota bacterium]